MDPRIRFLMVLASAIKNGTVKTIKQAMAFAKREFGEIDKKFVDDIVNVFKKEGKTKKGDVVPIKKKEGIMATDEAAEVVKKRTDDIAKGDPTGETSEIMEGLATSINKIKKQADELKKVADDTKPFMEIAEGPQKGKKITIDDFFEMTGAKGLDPKQGMVRTAAREILEKNKIKIGKDDPIDVFRKTYGEDALEAVDAIGDDLLNTQTYGEVNELLTKNKLFDLVPKKTYGYDQSVVSAEKIRKAKEQEAKNRQILDEFDIDPDRQPNAYGGIAGTLRLHRTGFKVGGIKKGIDLVAKYGPEFKQFADMLFIKASNMIRQGKGMWKGLDQKQMMQQHDNLTQKVNTFQKEGTLEGMDQYFGIDAEKAFLEAQAKITSHSGSAVKAGEGRFTKAEVLIQRLENTIKDMPNDKYVQETFPNFIKEIKADPKIANNENVWKNLGMDLPKNQQLVVHGDDTVDFFRQTEFGPHNIEGVTKFHEKHPFLTREEAISISKMEPTDQVMELTRLETIRKGKKTGVVDEFLELMKKEEKNLDEIEILSNLDTKGKKGHAEGGRVKMSKGGLPNILKL